MVMTYGYDLWCMVSEDIIIVHLLNHVEKGTIMITKRSYSITCVMQVDD